jgi:CRP-like cAMP-binding protein
VRRLSDLLVEAHYVPAERRVLRRISELAADADGQATPPVLPLTQEELSSLAGTSRATVNRVLGDAQARGEVALRRGRIQVLDPHRLAARAT